MCDYLECAMLYDTTIAAAIMQINPNMDIPASLISANIYMVLIGYNFGYNNR